MVVSVEENNLIEQIAKFEGLKELIEDDLREEDPAMSTYTNIASNHPPFKQLYLDLRVAYKKYKSRFVPSSITEVEFNATDSPFQYNDNWVDSIKKEFQKVNKNVVTFLESKNVNNADKYPSQTEEKCSTALKEQNVRLFSKIRSEMTQLTGSVDETYRKLRSQTELNPNQAQIYTAFQSQLMSVIDDKIPALFTSLVNVASSSDQADVSTIRQEIATFEDIEKKRLYQLVQIIAEKSSFVQNASTLKTDSLSKPAAAVHLKKVDPPTFSGHEVDFPEFERKWLAIVVPANLPEEAEVDRLRDALPLDAKEMLTGINKTAKAWDILKKRFGDKDLISTKLKHELKGLSVTTKNDHEKIISLVIKIRSLVSRLETLGTSEALKYDGEFVSAIYFQLPDRQKSQSFQINGRQSQHFWKKFMSALSKKSCSLPLTCQLHLKSQEWVHSEPQFLLTVVSPMMKKMKI